MLSASIESNRKDDAFAAVGAAEPRNLARFAGLAVGVVLGHAILVGLVAWSEMGADGAGATSAQEIPVEVASAEEAEGKQGSGEKARPAAPPSQIEPRDDSKQAQERPKPQQMAPQQPASRQAAQPEGKVVEPPKETDKPQASGARGAETKTEEKKEEPANPFGGLTAVEKPAAVERLPTFLSPSSVMTATRPKPADNPANDNYRAKVLGKVAANMIDPERPRPKALTVVGFRVDAAGALESVWIARPSGHADLDAEAVDMVKRSTPFPAPPPGAERNFGAAIAFGGD